jgi:cold-inducible RNA-binding protein
MKLYVGNLSFDTTENDLQDLFTPFGEVREVALIQDKMTNRSRGFGFVTMGDAQSAQAAIAALHEKNVAGRNLTVNEARAREERPARSFSGGGRR